MTRTRAQTAWPLVHFEHFFRGIGKGICQAVHGYVGVHAMHCQVVVGWASEKQGRVRRRQVTHVTRVTPARDGRRAHHVTHHRQGRAQARWSARTTGHPAKTRGGCRVTCPGKMWLAAGWKGQQCERRCCLQSRGRCERKAQDICCPDCDAPCRRCRRRGMSPTAAVWGGP